MTVRQERLRKLSVAVQNLTHQGEVVTYKRLVLSAMRTWGLEERAAQGYVDDLVSTGMARRMNDVLLPALEERATPSLEGYGA